MLIAWKTLIPSLLERAAELNCMIAGDLGPVIYVIEERFTLRQRAVAVETDADIIRSPRGADSTHAIDQDLREAVGIGATVDVQSWDADRIGQLLILIRGRDIDAVTGKPDTEVRKERRADRIGCISRGVLIPSIGEAGET
jgi:hypothetical protein